MLKIFLTKRNRERNIEEIKKESLVEERSKDAELKML